MKIIDVDGLYRDLMEKSGGAPAWGDITGLLSDQGDLQSALNAKQNSIGYTPENQANKSTNTSLGSSDTLYPSQKAVKTYVDGLAFGGGGVPEEMIIAYSIAL